MAARKKRKKQGKKRKSVAMRSAIVHIHVGGARKKSRKKRAKKMDDVAKHYAASLKRGAHKVTSAVGDLFANMTKPAKMSYGSARSQKH